LTPDVNALQSLKIERFIYLHKTDSTNEYAMNTLSNNDPNSNTCVYTFNQTDGRGQIGRFWYSGKDKNLTCSFRILLDNFHVKDQFLINRAFSLAIRSFIASKVQVPVTIKWPNDIYVGDKKIAGILIQNLLRSTTISSTILGVGININEDDFPDSIPNPIALKESTDLDYNLLDLQMELAEVVSQHIFQMEKSADLYSDAYSSHLYRKDQENTFIIDDVPTPAFIRGVHPDGKLELEFQGRRQLFGFREMQYVI